MTVDYNSWLREVRAVLQSINMPMDEGRKPGALTFSENIGQESMRKLLQSMPIAIGGTNKTKASGKTAPRQRIVGYHAITPEIASRLKRKDAAQTNRQLHAASTNPRP
jgi:hypothetical protein